MYRVFIWGTESWGEKCFQDILPEVEVVGFVESRVNKSSFHEKKVIQGQKLAEYQYDYVILANTHEEEIVQEFRLDRLKTVFYRYRPKLDGVMLFRYQIIDHAREMMPYLSVQCEGLTFLYNQMDIMIPNMMSFYQATWSRDEMEFLWREAPEKPEGIFMDIGANIGTTSIYFKKKLAPDLTYIAFEPVMENFQVLKMNCILNDCEDIKVENLGISDQEGTMGYTVVEANYGACRVTSSAGGENSCKIMQLDTYIKKNDISPHDISYIWVDVECHEANVIAGAKNLLLESDASLFMEYNAAEYRTMGKLEGILKDLQDIYSSFICYEQHRIGKTQKRHINELCVLADEMDWKQCNILFMK